ncbi:MAG TPA: hypothetical protein VJQ43_00955, partial [Thermoplasmata archaeon]|nr:hypothetical protein [Thermoplasmata archaeon]
AIVMVQNLYSVTVTTTCKLYASSSYTYAPRAAIEFNLLTVGAATQVALAEYSPQTSGGADATLNSITIS